MSAAAACHSVGRRAETIPNEFAILVQVRPTGWLPIASRRDGDDGGRSAGEGIGFAGGRRRGWRGAWPRGVSEVSRVAVGGRPEGGTDVPSAALVDYPALGSCRRGYGVFGVETASVGRFGFSCTQTARCSRLRAAGVPAATPSMRPVRLEGSADVLAAALVNESAFGRSWCRYSVRGVAFCALRPSIDAAAAPAPPRAFPSARRRRSASRRACVRRRS